MYLVSKLQYKLFITKLIIQEFLYFIIINCANLLKIKKKKLYQISLNLVISFKGKDQLFVTDITHSSNKINIRIYFMFSRVTRCSLSLGEYFCALISVFFFLFIFFYR